MLPRLVALQRIQAIAGRDAKITQRPSLIDETQLSQRGRLHVEREPAASAARPD
jgi:hypothetical protein